MLCLSRALPCRFSSSAPRVAPRASSLSTYSRSDSTGFWRCADRSTRGIAHLRPACALRLLYIFNWIYRYQNDKHYRQWAAMSRDGIITYVSGQRPHLCEPRLWQAIRCASRRRGASAALLGLSLLHNEGALRSRTRALCSEFSSSACSDAWRTAAGYPTRRRCVPPDVPGRP